jgi:hypothetical protein
MFTVPPTVIFFISCGVYAVHASTHRQARPTLLVAVETGVPVLVSWTLFPLSPSRLSSHQRLDSVLTLGCLDDPRRGPCSPILAELRPRLQHLGRAFEKRQRAVAPCVLLRDLFDCCTGANAKSSPCLMVPAAAGPCHAYAGRFPR